MRGYGRNGQGARLPLIRYSGRSRKILRDKHLRIVIRVAGATCSTTNRGDQVARYRSGVDDCLLHAQQRVYPVYGRTDGKMKR